MSNSSNFTFSPLNLKYFSYILGIHHVLKIKAPSILWDFYVYTRAYSVCDGNTAIRLVRAQHNFSVQVQAIFKIIYMEK